MKKLLILFYYLIIEIELFIFQHCKGPFFSCCLLCCNGLLTVFLFFPFCSCSCINTCLSWKNTFLPIHLTSWCFENLFFLFMLCREDLEGWSRYAVLSFTRCHLYFGVGSLFEQQVNRFISLDIYWPLRIILSTCLRLDISEHFTACYCARILSGCWSFLIRLLYLYSSYYMYWSPFLCLHLF